MGKERRCVLRCVEELWKGKLETRQQAAGPALRLAKPLFIFFFHCAQQKQKYSMAHVIRHVRSVVALTIPPLSRMELLCVKSSMTLLFAPTPADVKSPFSFQLHICIVGTIYSSKLTFQKP